MIPILKSITVGTVATGLTYFRYPTGTLTLFNMNYSLALGVGIAVMAGSILAEVLHMYAFPQVHFLDKMSEPVSAVVAGVSCTVGATTMFYLSDPKIINDLGLPLIVASAMLAEVTGDYVFTKFIHPMIA
jgi:hypothetical protein